MALTIVYEVDCHCGGQASIRTLDLTNPQDDGTVRIDVMMAVESELFTCDDCGCDTYTGDIVTESDEDTCPGAEARAILDVVDDDDEVE